MDYLLKAGVAVVIFASASFFVLGTILCLIELIGHIKGDL